jgi:hypothetical protein
MQIAEVRGESAAEASQGAGATYRRVSGEPKRKSLRMCIKRKCGVRKAVRLYLFVCVCVYIYIYTYIYIARVGLYVIYIFACQRVICTRKLSRITDAVHSASVDSILRKQLKGARVF